MRIIRSLNSSTIFIASKPQVFCKSFTDVSWWNCNSFLVIEHHNVPEKTEANILELGADDRPPFDIIDGQKQPADWPTTMPD